MCRGCVEKAPVLMLLSIHFDSGPMVNDWIYQNIPTSSSTREREYPLESPRLEVWDDFPDSGLPTFLFLATETWMRIRPWFETCSPKHLHGLRQKNPPLQPQLITQIKP
jgi:hypothetical protein